MNTLDASTFQRLANYNELLNEATSFENLALVEKKKRFGRKRKLLSRCIACVRKLQPFAGDTVKKMVAEIFP